MTFDVHAPFANRSMVFRDVSLADQSMVFAIDPWTQAWGIVSPIARRVLELADGQRSLEGITERLSSGDTVANAELGALVRDLREHHLLFANADEHQSSGGPVYRSTALAGVHLEITNACNLHCTHCYVSSGHRLPGELTTEELLKVVDELPAFSGKLVAISGGEPTRHPDCIAILKYCAIERGHRVDLYTNGVRVPEDVLSGIEEVAHMAPAPFRVQISLEGADARTHDSVRGRGSFVATMKTLDALRSRGLMGTTVLFMCVTKHNIHQVAELLRLAEALGVSTVVYSQWQRQGNARDVSWWDIAPSTAEWVRAGEHLLAYTATHPDGPRVFSNFFGDLKNDDWGRYALDATLFPKHVYAYNAFPRIAPDGKVFADQLMVDDVWCLGNVRDESLEALLQGSTVQAHLAQMRVRSSHVAECQECPWNALCESGSPGHTYSEYGTMFQKDVFCDARIYWFERFVAHQVARAHLAMGVTPYAMGR